MLPLLRIVRYDSAVPSVRKAVFPAAGLGTRLGNQRIRLVTTDRLAGN